jgi:serine/threonine protein kinase
MGPAAERSFATLGPALRMLGLALAVAGGQSARSVWLCLQAVFRGSDLRPLPSVADVLLGLLALAAGAFFLRQADDNAQALAGGTSVLPRLTLLRLVQPRFEHPLRELWSRSEPSTPEEPMPASRFFGALWGLGLAISVPLWAFALVAPADGRLAVLLIDAAHHAAIIAACAAAFHFAALLASRQDEAWARVKPSVITVPLRLATPRKAAAVPSPTPAPRPAPAPSPRVEAETARHPEPEPALQPASFKLPANCAICNAALSVRRCDNCGAPALAGPFRILRSLGDSGGRRTFLAESPDRNRVVLKELSFASAPDAQALDAFAREARTLRELRHPRVPAYVDAFREEDGARARLYLAYRYLEGISLLQEMDERRYTEDEVLDLVEEVLEILRHLHGLQPPLIHRDLKPANLVRRGDGSVALIDFGVARDLERTLHSGTLVGTIGYMPPEQLAGQVDVTCDLYALGATALHLLVRRAPWEFMDGPELRLPPLKTAPIARALLRRMVAPRRSQRFASAREALAALRRLRRDGARPPRTAWAVAGVCALTLAAVALGADQRLRADEAQMATRAPSARAAQAPPLPAVPVTLASSTPVTMAVTPDAAPLATWRGGKLTRAEVETGLRGLPPWLKANRPWWIQQHVLSLVRRKLLVAEAERRGLSALLPLSETGPERERLLARALLEIELRNEVDPLPARALRRAWERTTDALAASADVRLDERQLFQIEPERLLGSPPVFDALDGMGGRLEFFSRTGSCVMEVEPALRRYGGVCQGSKTLSDALLEPETLQLVDLAPGSVLPSGFYARLTNDFIESRRPGTDLLETARLAERSMRRADVRLTEATGTVPMGRAEALLTLVKPALRRCLALALFQAPFEPRRATARIRIELRAGNVLDARVESSPPLPAEGCAGPLARPELGGAGVLTFVAELERRQ